jgi:hypothetical protein
MAADMNTVYGVLADELGRHRRCVQDAPIPVDMNHDGWPVGRQDYQRPAGPLRHGRVVRNSVLSVR